VQLDVHTMLFAAIGILVGFQAFSFAVLGKFFCIRAGLRPEEEPFVSRLNKVTLEAGLAAGGLLILVGMGLWAGAVWFWSARGFGHLQPPQTLRWVIPGTLSLALGCQMILTCFFLDMLRLDTRGDQP
jgi:hypothetical protein